MKNLWIIVCLVFIAGLVSAVNINQCQDLPTGSYTVTAAIVANATRTVCLNVTGSSVTIDFAGYNITGTNAAGTIGVYTNQNNTIIKNGNFTSFATGVFSKGGYTTVFNNTILTNGAADAFDMQGVLIQDNNSANISYNTFSNITLHTSRFTYQSGEIVLLSTINTTVAYNTMLAGSSTGYHGDMASWNPLTETILMSMHSGTVSTGNTIFHNNITITGSYDVPMVITATSSYNNISWNTYTSLNNNYVAMVLPQGNNYNSITYNNFTALNVDIGNVQNNMAGVLLIKDAFSNVSFNTFNVSFAKVSGNPQMAIYSFGFQNISYNNITIGNGSNGVGICSDITGVQNNISGNKITSYANYSNGIILQDGNDIVLNNNISMYGMYSYGMQLQPNANLENVSQNIITANNTNGTGIFIWTTYSNNFSYNTINTTGYLGYGVLLHGGGNALEYFSNNKVNTTNADVIHIGEGTIGKGSFIGDTLTCVGNCNASIFLNHSSTSTFTNVSFDRTKVIIGNDVASSPNNFTVFSYVDLNVTYLNSSGVPSLWVNSTDAFKNLYQAQTSVAGLISNWTMMEYTNITNSSGNYVLNYTPHSIIGYDNSSGMSLFANQSSWNITTGNPSYNVVLRVVLTPVVRSQNTSAVANIPVLFQVLFFYNNGATNQSFNYTGIPTDRLNLTVSNSTGGSVAVVNGTSWVSFTMNLTSANYTLYYWMPAPVLVNWSTNVTSTDVMAYVFTNITNPSSVNYSNVSFTCPGAMSCVPSSLSVLSNGSVSMLLGSGKVVNVSVKWLNASSSNVTINDFTNATYYLNVSSNTTVNLSSVTVNLGAYIDNATWANLTPLVMVMNFTPANWSTQTINVSDKTVNAGVGSLTTLNLVSSFQYTYSTTVVVSEDAVSSKLPVYWSIPSSSLIDFGSATPGFTSFNLNGSSNNLSLSSSGFLSIGTNFSNNASLRIGSYPLTIVYYVATGGGNTGGSGGGGGGGGSVINVYGNDNFTGKTVLTRSVFDAGALKAGDKISYAFNITNTRDTATTISFYPENTFVVIRPASALLESGQTASFVIDGNAPLLADNYSQSIQVLADGQQDERVTVSVVVSQSDVTAQLVGADGVSLFFQIKQFLAQPIVGSVTLGIVLIAGIIIFYVMNRKPAILFGLLLVLSLTYDQLFHLIGA